MEMMLDRLLTAFMFEPPEQRHACFIATDLVQALFSLRKEVIAKVVRCVGGPTGATEADLAEKPIPCVGEPQKTGGSRGWV
jgi:hypothetical protein